MSGSEERGAPLVEVLVKGPAEKPSGGGRLRRALGLGFVGAVLLIGAVSFGGGVFLPWFSTSAEDTPSKCEPHIEVAVGEALTNLTLSQAIAAAIGFIVFAVIGLLRGRRPGADA